jgi:transcriptional antiterminator RfaH
MGKTPAAPHHWFAVHTNARQEALAAGRLWQYCPVFLPRRRITIRHARRETIEIRPALPRYLFVRARQAEFGIVNRTPGVSTMLTIAGTPPAIPDQVFDAFRSNFDRDGVAVDDEAFEGFRSPFAPGDEVRLTCGPLEGLMGRVERIDTTGSLRLLIAMFGRFVETSVVAEWAEAVSKPISPVPAEPYLSAA